MQDVAVIEPVLWKNETALFIRAVLVVNKFQEKKVLLYFPWFRFMPNMYLCLFLNKLSIKILVGNFCSHNNLNIYMHKICLMSIRGYIHYF